MSIRVRFAPSPTGYLHIGNARAALLNYLFAKKHGGTFILRLDDTDVERSLDLYEKSIFDDLHWLGLKHDLFFKQSERSTRYNDVIEVLKKEGRLYPCYETAEELDVKRKRQLAKGMPPIYDREALLIKSKPKDRRPHWRFLIDNNKDIVWHDLIKGEMHFNAKNLSDPVLIKENGAFLYTLTSVVDDFDYDITHIIRGEDHVVNTAVQIQLFQALGTKLVPQFAHFTLLLDETGAPLSKRLGSLSLKALQEQGFEAMTINSLLARLGTSKPVQPFQTLFDLQSTFDLSIFSKTPPRFAEKDLLSLNHKLLKNLPYAAHSIPLSKEQWDLVKDNINTLKETYVWEKIFKGEPNQVPIQKDFAFNALSCLPKEPWDENTWHTWVDQIPSPLKGKELFLELRMILTGLRFGPEMKKVLPLIGYSNVKKILMKEIE